jgi:hypothetical protein
MLRRRVSDAPLQQIDTLVSELSVAQLLIGKVDQLSEHAPGDLYLAQLSGLLPRGGEPTKSGPFSSIKASRV